MNKHVVLVTAIGTTASTTVISQLRKAGDYYIIGADIYKKNQVVTAKDVDEFYTFPSSIKDLEGYITFVGDFCKEHHVEYYFATIDEEIVNMSEHRAMFNEIGVKLCIANHEAIMTCHYKDQLCEWIDQHVPQVGMKRFERFKDVEEFPVFIKPKEGRGSAGCRRVDTMAAAEALLREGLKEQDYLIQEFFDSEIVTVDLVRNAKTGQMQQIQRVEEIRNGQGCGIAIKIVNDERLACYCEAIMEKLNLNGVVNAEFFHTGNQYRIIEINPRFGAGTSFSVDAGCDIVMNAISIVNDEKCELGTPIIGAHFAKRYETYRLD